MLTFNNAGRFGNFFLECCTMLAYGLKHNLEFTVPPHQSNPFSPVYFLHLVNPNYNPNLEQVRLWESKHTYEELPFDESWRQKNIIIEGYRQSWKYFDDYRNEIIYLLDFPYEKKDNYVGVHVRRTDYLILKDKHPEVKKEWYEKAMSLFPDHRFKFYSDDINWCRQEFGNRSDCEFSTSHDVIADVSDAASCSHNIISASTFGWSIGWLNRNPDKKVVIPEKWFVDGYHLDTTDIVPPYFTKL
jgi:glycosyl transferase family 11